MKKKSIVLFVLSVENLKAENIIHFKKNISSFYYLQ